MRRPEAKNPPERPLMSAETGNVENRRQESPQKRGISDRRRFPRFGKTGWWRRKGPNCQPPTQSSSNRSLTPPGTEIFDAETGAETPPFRLLETDTETR